MAVHNPAGAEVFYVDPTEPTRPNRIVNWGLYKKLVQEFKTTGWDGAPLVMLFRDHYDPPGKPLAITGSHRLAAAEEAGVTVPCVGIATLFEKRGLDLDDLLDEWLPEGVAYSDEALLQAVAQVLRHLPDRVPAWMFASYDINLNYCWGTAAAADGHQHMCGFEPEHILDEQEWHECVVCGADYDATRY
ncbi:MAG TPA: hypothetical protein VGL02_32410 [Streptomyces sp.]